MANTYLSRTASGGSRTTWTISTWVKRGSLGSGLSSNIFDGIAGNTQNESQLLFLEDSIELYDYSSASRTGTLLTNAKYRDTSAWYHIVAVWDTTNATAGDRMRLYVNGVEETSFATDTQPSLNQNSSLGNGTYTQQVGLYGSNSSYYFNGSMSHFHFIDGTAYDASAFGETDATTGIWKPKTSPSVTYGTNGFFLKFENSGSMGTDSSPNGNNFTVNGTMTQTVDTPSNVFATNNVLSLSASGVTNANGNLSVTDNASNAWRDLFGTLGVSAGKWYWEQKIDNFATGIDPHRIGICDAEYFNNSATGSNFEDAGISRVYGYCKTGQKINAGSITSYGDSWTTGDIIGIAMDLDNGKIYFSKNGTWQNSGDPTSGATGTGSAFNVTTNYTYLPSTSTYYTDNRYSYNFGNGYFGTTAVSSATSDESGLGIFEYTVPSGYYALCTKNINEQG
jgi:hypothetical protein